MLIEGCYYEVWNGDLYIDTVDYHEALEYAEAGYSLKLAVGYES